MASSPPPLRPLPGPSKPIASASIRARAAPPADPTRFNSIDANMDCWAAPFANFGHNPEEFSPKWWLQYFAKEARTQEAQRIPHWTEEWVRVLNALFIKGPIPAGVSDESRRGWWAVLRPGLDSSGPRPASVPGSAPAPVTDPDTVWKDAMTRLLKLGFRAVTNGETAPAGVHELQSDNSVASAHMLHQRMFGKKVAELEKSMDLSSIPLYWRSEARDVRRIVSQQGTKRQCEVDTIAAEMHMDAPWHPFSDPALSRYMWFRLANLDNDYYTAISVATGFETACSFPKIDEKRVYSFPPLLQVSQWTKAQADRFRSHLGLVCENDREAVRIVTRTTTYMLVHTGSVLDTKGANQFRERDAFPEIGVDRIPLKNIYCVVPIRRVHHGPSPADGITVFIDFMGCERLHSATEIDLFGTGLASRLFGIYREKISQPAFATAWSSRGAAAPGIPTNITRIVEFPIGDGKFQTFRNTLRDA